VRRTFAGNPVAPVASATTASSRSEAEAPAVSDGRFAGRQAEMALLGDALGRGADARFLDAFPTAAAGLGMALSPCGKPRTRAALAPRRDLAFDWFAALVGGERGDWWTVDLGIVSSRFLNRELWQSSLPLRQLRPTLGGWSLTKRFPRSPNACARSALGPA
jgi:hypothetical protein